MGGVAGYSIVHARVRAMYADMLNRETSDRLCEAADLATLIHALKETVYGPYLSLVAEEALTPRRTVYQIKGHLADAFVTVIRSVPERVRPVFLQLYRLYEVDNLKAVLRGIAAGASWDEVRYVLFPLGSLTVLPAQDMVEAANISAAVEMLRGTPYYGPLAHAMERYAAEQSLFPLEVALDLDYWRHLWRDLDHLSGRDKEQAVRLVGSLIDMNNLMWAIRYRVYHRLSEEEIINYTLPFGYRVQDVEIRAIAAGADIPQVIARVYPDLPDLASLSLEPGSKLPELERRLQQHIAGRCRAAFVGYPFHAGIPLAYVLLKELEVQDLTVLVEAKSRGMPVREFVSYLVVLCMPEE